MKAIAILIPFLAVTLLLAFNEPPKRWLVTSDSSIEISGTSNINAFECLNLSYKGNDTLYEEKAASPNIIHLGGSISLEAEKFDCKNKFITRDFRNTLEADKHPEIKVRFLNLKVHKGTTEAEPVEGQVEITIAGISKKYDLKSRFNLCGKNKAQLIGEKAVSLSDFGLEPKSRFLGMIKVDDTVKVNFTLFIRSI